MRLNATLASESLRSDGITVQLGRLGTHQELVIVTKTNPALRIQKQAVQMIRALSVEITDLQEQCRAREIKQQDDADWEELSRV
jgi:hypothetical protein